MVYKSGQIFLPFCHNSRVWQTDRRTKFSSQYRVCITCSAVKISYRGDSARRRSFRRSRSFKVLILIPTESPYIYDLLVLLAT